MISFKTTIWKKKYLAVKKDLKMCVCEDNFQMFNRLQLKSLKIHMSSMWVSYTLYIFNVFEPAMSKKYVLCLKLALIGAD